MVGTVVAAPGNQGGQSMETTTGGSVAEAAANLQAGTTGWGKESARPANNMGANKKLDHALATSMAIVMSGMEWTQGKRLSATWWTLIRAWYVGKAILPSTEEQVAWGC